MNKIPRFKFPKLKNDLIAKVFNREPVSRVPVWMMRQAGRTDPEYCKLRKEDGRPLEQVFQDIELSTEISLLPCRFGVDAIIMFQDILTPLTPMGVEFKFTPSPKLESPIVSMDQVKKLKTPYPYKELQTVGKILKSLNYELNGNLPVIGFAGAPMTLAFFMISGQSPTTKIPKILEYIENHSGIIEALMDRLTIVIIDYLLYQLENGAHVVQLFESFADVIPEPIYTRWVQPSHEKIFSALKYHSPSILFAKECHYLDLLASTGADALSLGHGINLSKVQKKYPDLIVQGNVDNLILADQGKERISEAIQKCLGQTRGRNHIMNLSHGLLERTPFENVLYFVDNAKSQGRGEVL